MFAKSTVPERNRKLMTFLLMAFSYAPFLVLAKLPDFGSTQSLLYYLASQFGYLAAVLLLWQFILGSRSVSGLWLKDQAWSVKWHKRFGKFGIALVLTHPLLITYKYGESYLYLFFDQLDSTFARGVALGRLALIVFLVIWISSALLRSRLAYRPWKYIHYLNYLILPLILFHAPKVGSFYAGQESIRLLWAIFIFVYLIALILRLRHIFTFNQYKYKLIAKKQLKPGIIMYKFLPLEKRLQPKPGQYIYSRRSFWSEEHPFSVVNYDPKDGAINITSKIFGNYTKKLSKMTLGDFIYLDGPYGVFTREIDDDNRPIAFIAGGIGITPFIRHCLGKNRQRISLFYANRTPDSVVYDSILKKCLGKRYVKIFSDYKPEKGIETGFVNAKLVKKYLGKNYTNHNFYICGPKGMMTQVKQTLIDSGIDKQQIYSEEFGF